VITAVAGRGSDPDAFFSFLGTQVIEKTEKVRTYISRESHKPTTQRFPRPTMITAGGRPAAGRAPVQPRQRELRPAALAVGPEARHRDPLDARARRGVGERPGRNSTPLNSLQRRYGAVVPGPRCNADVTPLNPNHRNCLVKIPFAVMTLLVKPT